MKSRFKAELCVYCGKTSATTSDHVVSRKFFLVKHRDNLPQVPSCRPCNNEKAALEAYLTVVLAFGGRHLHAVENLRTMVPKRLAKNAKLHRELAAGLAKSDGSSIPLDSACLEKLFRMIAQGLAWHHWKVRLRDQHASLASIFHDIGTLFFEQPFSNWNTREQVSENLGEGTFVYEGKQATDYPEMTVWRFWMYGGVVFGGDVTLPGPASVAIAVTGPLAFINNLRFKGAASRRKIGRNELCPCESGKKFKKCHGASVLRPTTNG